MTNHSAVQILPDYFRVKVKPGFKFATLGAGHPHAGMNAIVDGDGVIPVLPMNGWRSRNFAEEILGERNSSLLTLGTARLVRAGFLQELPGWDAIHTEYLKRFYGMVAVEVVAVNPGYGCYIAVEQVTIPAMETNGREAAYV